MKAHTIITGSWYPRTRFHLQEYYEFLQNGTALQELDKKEVKKAQRRLLPDNVTYIGLSEGGRFDHVDADLDGFSSTFYEDGLLLVSKPIKDLEKDYKSIHKFYEQKMTTALMLIYSVGVPSITFRKGQEHVHTTVILAKSTTRKSVDAFMESHKDEVEFVAKDKSHKVFFGKKHVIIETKAKASPVTAKVITSMIFFREFEGRLHNFLNLHRKVWAGIQEIRERASMRLKELPEIRDSLLDNQRDLAIVKARLGQMSDYIEERQKEIDEFGLEKHLRKLEVYRFGKMRTNAAYMSRLWNMLEDYIGSTVKIIDLIYQDNIQKQLNVQQFIFLVGAVGGIIALGKLADSDLVMLTPSGEFGYIGALMFFGSMSVLISILVYVFAKHIVPALLGMQVKKKTATDKKLFKEENPE